MAGGGPKSGGAAKIAKDVVAGTCGARARPAAR